MSRPFFSVIIPSHNGEMTIEKAIKSVRRQTFRNYELIVVCDACTDMTESIADEYYARIVHSDYHCEGMARNLGVDAAIGYWILFLDDDDWFLHEYCFQMLHDEIGRQDCNVLNYGYIWKGKGYQSARNHRYSMAWARAWDSKLIKQFQFDDSAFGTDKSFYNDAVLNNPDARVGFFDTPIVYYNYFREGSMTQKLKKHKQLSIIITHYNEPWETGKPMFDILENQLMVDKESFSVILVQDGEEHNLAWDKLLKGYTYDIKTLCIPHSGISQARNAGLENASSDWVMFCDFDDFFTSVMSLQMIMGNLDTQSMDVICGDVLEERRTNGSDIWVAVIKQHRMFDTHCKVYRRSVLADISFPDSLHYASLFNDAVLKAVGSARIFSILSDFPLYCKKLRDGGFFNHPDILRQQIKTVDDTDTEWKDREAEYLIRTLHNNFLIDDVR